MKVAYISVFFDGTGYSNAAQRSVLALDAVGVDVACRSVHLSPNLTILPKRLQELHKKDMQNVDVTIQHILPHMFHVTNKTKNIGSFSWETTHFKSSSWRNKCELMDAIFTSCVQAEAAIKNSRVSKPTYVLPYPVDLNSYNFDVEELPVKEFKNKCVFYTIAELSQRKNMSGLILAYLSAFSYRDDVVLFIKTYKNGVKGQQVTSELHNLINEIKARAKLSGQDRYPQIIIAGDYWDDNRLQSLHQSSDVFCSTAKGESWCLPAIDAMAFGNPVIASKWGSFPGIMSKNLAFEDGSQTFCVPGGNKHDEFLSDCGWLIDGHLVPVFGQEGFKDLYTARESWFSVDTFKFADAMNEAYKLWQNNKLKNFIDPCKRNLERFSYKNIGNQMKEVLKNIA